MASPRSNANDDGRPDSCVSLAFHHLGISQDVIEGVQALAPIHTIPYPLWVEVLEVCALNKLEALDWHGTLKDFLERHINGKYFVIVEMSSEEDVRLRRTHAVAVVDGVVHNMCSGTDKNVFRVWKTNS